MDEDKLFICVEMKEKATRRNSYATVCNTFGERHHIMTELNAACALIARHATVAFPARTHAKISGHIQRGVSANKHLLF